MSTLRPSRRGQRMSDLIIGAFIAFFAMSLLGLVWACIFALLKSIRSGASE